MPAGAGADSGMRIGPYEVLGEVGRGGMGVVFRARSEDGAAVALKLLLRPEAAAQARFAREQRLLAALSEAEGFVPFLAAGESPQGPWLAMPFVEGGTLRERLARGPLGLDEALALGRRLATAMGLAHARGLVHRDLKPENVLFTRDGRALIADLGLAKHFSADAPGASQSQDLSRTGELRGTFGYMAPEQSLSAKGVGPPADVFSLGAILYECLSGRPAFVAATQLELLARSEQGRFEPLPALRPDAPAWLAALVQRTLAPDPGDRPADGAALARALAGPGPRGGRRAARPAMVAWGAAGLLSAVGVVLALRGPLGSAPAAPVEGVLSTASASAAGPASVSEEPALPDERPDEPSGVDRSAQVEGLLVQARRLRDTVGDAEALALVTEALELDPGSVEALTERGNLRMRAGDLQGAIADLDSAIAGGALDVRTWIQRADAHLRSGHLALAEQDATRALAIDPQRPRPWLLRGQARMHQGDKRAAFDDLCRAIELNPTNALAPGLRARLRIDRGEFQEAIRDATVALNLDPQLAAAWEARAAARAFLEGDPALVLADADRAISLSSEGMAMAWWARGEARLRRGETAGAIEDLSQAVVPGSGFVLPLMTRASAHLRAGHLEQAIEDATAALEVAPRVVLGCHLIRAQARAQTGDRQGAIADLERFLELAPDSASAPDARRRLEALRASADGPGR